MTIARPKCTKIGYFSAQGWTLPKKHMPTCLKRRVVVNRTFVSSVSFIAYDEHLQTGMDRANTMYADGHFCRHICAGMTRFYRDVKLKPLAFF